MGSLRKDTQIHPLLRPTLISQKHGSQPLDGDKVYISLNAISLSDPSYARLLLGVFALPIILSSTSSPASDNATLPNLRLLLGVASALPLGGGGTISFRPFLLGAGPDMSFCEVVRGRDFLAVGRSGMASGI